MIRELLVQFWHLAHLPVTLIATGYSIWIAVLASESLRRAAASDKLSRAAYLFGQPLLWAGSIFHSLYNMLPSLQVQRKKEKLQEATSQPVLKEYLMPNLDPAAQKAAIKEAIQEWMNEQFAAFGRWTFYGLLVAAFAGAVYLALAGRGLVKV